MNNIVFEHVVKAYGKNVIVNDLNMEIREGERLILLGPSGCGKPTTLRMIAGLEDISEGDLLIGGKRMNDVEPKDRDIAMVFQSYALYPHMTVYENMAFALKLRKVPKEEIDKKVREAAEILDITQYLDRKPKALSGGQRQRVAIGRAIVREPKVLLMDEPLSNLDAKLRNQMRAEIIKLRQRIDTTFVYVTHDQTEAMTLGDRIVIMKSGVVQQIGTPQMNFFPGRLEQDESSYRLHCMGAVIPLTQEQSSRLAQNGQRASEVIVGVRPEHISVQNQEDGAIEAFVEVSELMGSEVYLHTVVGSGGERQNAVLRIPTVDLPPQYHGNVPAGTKIRFGFSSSLLHLFDPDTEKSVFC